jgi:N-acetylglucosaminyl-diphospho-decaprenol L-rhamnosyltransferase
VREFKLSVIVVTHNDRGHLENCLESLARADGANDMEIYVVDNASTDGTPEFVADKYPEIHLVLLTENMGFSKANNIGLRQCRGQSVMFLNPDTALPKNGLTGLLAALDNPAVGAVGPILYNRENHFQVSFGGRRTFFRELIQKGVLNPCLKRRIGRLQRPRRVTWISGACLCVRREVLDGVGGFDEHFFLYFEDIDLCYRIRKANWEILVHPEIKIFHAGGASTGRQPLRSRYYYRRSQIYFYRKHNGPLSRGLLKLYLAVLCVPFLLKGKKDPQIRELKKDFIGLLRY